MRIEDGFQPVAYEEGNPYTSDPALPSLLKRTIPEPHFAEINAHIIRYVHDIQTVVRPSIQGRVGPPQLTQYDQWGRRVDVLETSEGWRYLKAFCQKEGLPGIFYERKYGEYSRIFGFALAFLLTGDGHVIFCPTSMTDGAARVLELMGTPDMKSQVLPKLTSRDPSIALTAGQWMTERTGGSDVSRLETVASDTGKVHALGRQYSLDGFKWFTSAADGDLALALGRTGSVSDGARGLSLFMVPLRLPLLRDKSQVPSPTSNNIFIHRLKNKIGTIAVPTTELSLQGSEAYLIGQLGQGVKNITPVLNITRVWSALGSVGFLRKALNIATAYAKVREIDGGKRLLRDTPLHVSHLASISLVYRALVHLIFGAVRLLGKSECGVASAEEERRLRLLTPVIKAFAAEKACAAMENSMTALGGAGYMEENEFGRLIRDGLVEKIWEGTTDVLALDLVRSARDPATIKEFVAWAREVMNGCPSGLQNQLQSAFSLLNKGLKTCESVYQQQPIPELVPRPGLMVVGYIASSIFLLEQAVWSHQHHESDAGTDLEVFRRWTEEGGLDVAIEEVSRVKRNGRSVADSAIVFGKL